MSRSPAGGATRAAEPRDLARVRGARALPSQPAMRIHLFWGIAVAAILGGCGQELAAGDDTAGDDSGDDASGDDGTFECFSQSECPVGWTCSEFGTCVPPPTGVDAAPPE